MQIDQLLSDVLQHVKLDEKDLASLAQSIEQDTVLRHAKIRMANNQEPQTHRRVVGDSAKCIGCGTCMAGCIIAHYQPGVTPVSRIQIIKTNDLSMPTVCRQCTHADCAEACPEGVLYSAGYFVKADHERCIGCNNCVIACPQGAITITRQSQRIVFEDLIVSQGTRPHVEKCDLCQGKPTGPTCISVCPTAALDLVNTCDYDQIEQLAEREALPIVSVPQAFGEEKRLTQQLA